MAMLTMNGTIINVFETPIRNGKDGQTYGGQYKIQIMAENELQNGQIRNELHDLTVDTVSPFKSLVGQMVRIPVGVYARDKGVGFYMLKNAKPEVVN